MVGTTLTIERDIEDARNTGMRVLMERERKVSLPPVRGRGRDPLVREDLRVTAIRSRDI